jgi:zinc-binding in reverse transcriptase
MLTKENLIKKGWQGNIHCIFYNDIKRADHLFIHCSLATCLWSWIASYNNFHFSYFRLDEL